MTSKPASLRLAIVLSLGAGAAAACGALACSKATSAGRDSGGGASAAKTAVLSAASACIYDTYSHFVETANAMATATTAAAAAPADPAKYAAAQEAWRAAYDVWQEAESFQVGPAALKTAELGGDDRRDPIYSWPLVSRCAIEEALVAKAYAADFASALVNVKGLAALEYVLFSTATDNACAASSPINQSGSWAALGATELAQRKADYAAVLAADLVTQATTLKQAWAPESGNFVAKLTTAGAGSSVYPTDQMGLNALSDGLFYIEHSAKDMKLGRPLGITPCTDATCSLTEAPYARRSKEALRHNYIGFKKIFSGCGADYTGQGFDDLLVGVGATELASQMNADIGAIFTAIDALGDQTLEDALAKDKAKVQAIYDAMKVVTNDLRSQFIGILDLELPKSVEGDND